MNCPMNVVSYAQRAFNLISLFFRLDQPVRMRSSNALMTAHTQLLLQPQVSMGTRDSNGRCSDAMTLPINDWLFHLEGRTIPPYCALHLLPFISIGVSCLCISIVFDVTLHPCLVYYTLIYEYAN